MVLETFGNLKQLWKGFRHLWQF